MAVTFDREANQVRLAWHRIFQPSPDDPLDFEATVESTLLELRGRFDVREVRYDPYQLVADAETRLAISRCVALETSRGWRIAKEKVSHKIDVVVALAMAALGAVLKGQQRDSVMEYITRQLEKERQVKEAGQLCAKPGCGKVLQPDVGITQARGLKSCSLACSW